MTRLPCLLLLSALALNWAMGPEPETVNWTAGDGAEHYGE